MDVIREYLDQLMDLVGPRPWLRAGIAVTAAFFAAFVVDFIARRVLKVITRKTKTGFDDQIIDILRRPFRTTMVLLGFWVAVQQLGLSPLAAEEGSEALVPSNPYEAWIGSLLLTIGVWVWVSAALRITSLVLRTLATDQKRVQVIEPATLPLFDNLFKVLLFGAGVYGITRAWGGDAGTLLASAGVAGIAIGFAAKDTLANLFSGVFIIADAPYRLGDFIVLDSGERGQVVDIGLRSTRLLTRDDIEVTIPNAVMGAAKIMNETGGPESHRRVRIPVGVAYGSDIDQVRSALEKVAAKESLVIANPAARVRFRAFGNSTLDFELLAWIREPLLRGQATDALLSAVYKEFAAQNIEIAFPQLDVHLHRTKS